MSTREDTPKRKSSRYISDDLLLQQIMREAFWKYAHGGRAGTVRIVRNLCEYMGVTLTELRAAGLE